MVFARGLFLRGKRRKEQDKRTRALFRRLVGVREYNNGENKKWVRRDSRGKKRDIWCFRVSGLDTKKKTTKTTKTLKDTKDNTNAVFFRRHVVRVGARKRRRRRRRRQVGGAFNNAFNARRSFSVAQQRLFRFGELERRRRRVELHDAPIFCRGEILGKLGAERR